MTIVTPPLFQTVDSVYTGADLGLPYSDLIAEGVVGSGDLAVSERGAGANMSVDVAAGVAWIKGDDAASQPTYRAYNDGVVNLAVDAADGSNDRIDLVIAEVRDSAFSGVSTDWRLRIVTGTPAGSPSAPATPNNAIVLAQILVPTSTSDIEDGDITDLRPRAGIGSLSVPTLTALPSSPYDGQVIDYLADATNGVVWRLKYRAASASSYKWEYVGGPPLTAEVATQQSTTSTSYADLSTVGPTVTAALAGDYMVTISASVQAASAQNAKMSYAIGASAAGDADSINSYGSASVVEASDARTQLKTAIAASTALTAKYKVSGGTGYFQYRYIAITPVRVG
jgi:hypothetical protein